MDAVAAAAFIIQLATVGFALTQTLQILRHSDFGETTSERHSIPSSNHVSNFRRNWQGIQK